MTGANNTSTNDGSVGGTKWVRFHTHKRWTRSTHFDWPRGSGENEKAFHNDLRSNKDGCTRPLPSLPVVLIDFAVEDYDLFSF